MNVVGTSKGNDDMSLMVNLYYILKVNELVKVLVIDDSWWDLPLPRFNGLSAHEMITAGRGKELLEYVKTYEDPSFG